MRIFQLFSEQEAIPMEQIYNTSDLIPMKPWTDDDWDALSE